MSIPRYPDDITGEWLSAVLSSGETRVRVSEVGVAAVGTGQTGATYRVSVTYASDAGRLPDTFVIKLPAQDDTVRDTVTIGYRSECAFYTAVADRVRVPTPQWSALNGRRSGKLIGMKSSPRPRISFSSMPMAFWRTLSVTATE